MLGQLKRQWLLHLKRNTLTYLLVVFVFITGIMAGAFTVISLPTQQRINVGNFLVQFFNSQQNLSVNRWSIFKESLWQHFITAILIWGFGIFPWGIPLVLAILGIRGFSFGFTIGFMVEHYRYGGVLFSLICILPQSIIYVPCYLAMGIVASLCSLINIGKKGMAYSPQERQKKIGLYTWKIAAIFAILLVGIIIETLISPLLFPLFIWIFRK